MSVFWWKVTMYTKYVYFGMEYEVYIDSVSHGYTDS